MNTVNVIDCKDRDSFQIDGMWSFPETQKGNEQAEECFARLIRETKECTDEDMQMYLDNGICDIGDGYIAIVHGINSHEDV